MNKRGNGFKDLTGQRFCKLLVLEFFECEKVQLEPKVKYKSVWKCQCDCGQIAYIRANSLVSDRTKSCGCHKSAVTREFNAKNKTKINYDTFSCVWGSYKRGAKTRGLDFNLTKDQFFYLTQQNCAYCDAEPVTKRIPRVKTKLSDYIYNGIDRVNSDLGYEMDNCVSCCSICNRMKVDMPVDLFKAHIKKINNHISRGV
jgi:hypothetical protein